MVDAPLAAPRPKVRTLKQIESEARIFQAHPEPVASPIAADHALFGTLSVASDNLGESK